MADHLIGKFWGLMGALAAALLTLALIAPAGAEAASPASGALSQLGAVIPAPARSAVSAALSEIPTASGAGAPGVPQPVPPPHVPVPASPVPPVGQTMQSPTPASPADVGDGHAVVVPAVSVPQPDAAPRAVQTASNLTTTIRPDSVVGGARPAHRLTRPRAHRHTAAARWARASRTGGIPIVHTLAVRPLSPVPVFETTSRRGTQPAVPARRADSHGQSRRAHHIAPRRSRPGAAANMTPVALPLSAALPPGGAEGSAAGAGGAAAGAATAALLVIVGLCILRALLPGLLGLGLAPARSAFLVSRLERPG